MANIRASIIDYDDTERRVNTVDTLDKPVMYNTNFFKTIGSKTKCL